MVTLNAWNLAWILPLILMFCRAVFCQRDEPMERIVALLNGLAEIAIAAAAALREWRR